MWLKRWGRPAGFIMLLALPAVAQAQDAPADEVQVNLNSYFDNFNVKIYYPTLSLTKRFSDSTSVTARYLVDVISAASMRSHFDVDGVTSATQKDDGGGDDKPDEIRHEFSLGVTDIMRRGLLPNGSLSVNAIYSREHDYSSFTLAAMFSHLMAKKNTTLQAGVVRSWDRVFPQIRDWRASKDVLSLSLGLTQILSPRMISQLLFSYNESEGLLHDPYQVVQVIDGDQVLTLEPVHPESRIRRAVGARLNYKLDRASVLNGALRYYWDSWQITSWTASLQYQRQLSAAVTVGAGLRRYTQTAAYFFAERYDTPAPYMTVDTKLDANVSNDYEIKLSLNGGHWRTVPVLADPNLQLNMQLNFYHRRSATPDWHSRARDLYAYIFTFGIRYRF